MTDRATRVFIVYTCMTALTEVIAAVSGHFRGTNMIVYAAYEVIGSLCIGCRYCRITYYCLQWVADYDGRTTRDEHHLWFSVILAGYSSVTFFGYGLYSYLSEELKGDLNIYHNCLVLKMMSAVSI